MRVAEGRVGRVEQRYVDNLCVGLGVGELGLADITQGNFTVPRAALQDADVGAYALPLNSWLRGRGVDAGSEHGVSLRAAAEFTPPVGTRPIEPPAAWSPGAYQD